MCPFIELEVAADGGRHGKRVPGTFSVFCNKRRIDLGWASWWGLWRFGVSEEVPVKAKKEPVLTLNTSMPERGLGREALQRSFNRP